jgi:hypothetical protein
MTTTLFSAPFGKALRRLPNGGLLPRRLDAVRGTGATWKAVSMSWAAVAVSSAARKSTGFRVSVDVQSDVTLYILLMLAIPGISSVVMFGIG